MADCKTGNPNCKTLTDNPPGLGPGPGLTLEYVPALISGTDAVAVPGCATGSDYQGAIAGCDQSTVYACGIIGGGAQADLTFNPASRTGIPLRPRNVSFTKAQAGTCWTLPSFRFESNQGWVIR